MADMDTAAKRYSIVGIDLSWPIFLPIPDGAIGAADRQHLLHKYSGIAFSGAPAGPAYGLDDNTTMMSLYIADTLFAQAGYLNEDVRDYFDDVRGTTGNNDLNSAVWTDLKT
jgi:hypothetical protein